MTELSIADELVLLALAESPRGWSVNPHGRFEAPAGIAEATAGALLADLAHLRRLQPDSSILRLTCHLFTGIDVMDDLLLRFPTYEIPLLQHVLQLAKYWPYQAHVD